MSEKLPDRLYSPRQVLKDLKNGYGSPTQIAAGMDVDAFNFMPRVDDGDGSIEPIFQTSSFQSAPSSGRLASSLDIVDNIQSQNEQAVMFWDYNEGCPSREVWMSSAGLLTLCPTGKDPIKGYNGHFLIMASSHWSTFCDVPKNPQISATRDGLGIVFPNGKTLRDYDEITTEPMTGRIWDKKLPILSPDPESRQVADLLQTALGDKQRTKVSLHFTRADDKWLLERLSEIRENMSIGLYRSDVEVKYFLEPSMQENKDLFETLSSGVVPFSLGQRSIAGKFLHELDANEINFRLPDLHNMRDIFPEHIQQALDRGDDHDPSSSLFTMRKTLYRHAILSRIEFARNNTEYMGKDRGEISRLDLIKEKDLTITLPCVENAEEVRILKEAVYEMLPEDMRKNVKFSVMAETLEAAKNIEEIAPLCDGLCCGMNGMTHEYTGLDRDVWDHSEWMKKEGHRGSNPYEVLIDPVADIFDDMIQRARKVNPNIHINMCGHQVAGHDIDSINRVLDMGVEEITVPPHPHNVLRAELAVISHRANQELACMNKLYNAPYANENAYDPCMY